MSHVASRVFFLQAEDGIRDIGVTGVQTCALPILPARAGWTSDDLQADREGRLMPGPQRRGGRAGGGNDRRHRRAGEIGRASCRERVQISAVAVSLTKTIIQLTSPHPPYLASRPPP